ncbi:UDP-N-acetylglucosamine--N-acetylmuramyl-(pentapeptide) pyrophosphoryl-undecaprenol N-acetylglucosamine transferase [Candidatus Pelagibacter sp.]|jgi:UDP-N-acetylglucosamine--N-acetylmuramyl-(pentapeptide) pyrophosphoryl-undecaprenol N-acetylglucosamine transferase|nr:UDP-N-acetylglucosamine--N-acetylmuramyl-(pentapeptide) pyrophosphoryl-undecaprenol N-acetylglucosamine transferase [Candidatus Pelagibacter sp.]|tara:strand:+ start:892 stop:1962 length:1071 start_codon:yes stop_codon:yes gene_type:complete
MKKNILISTGGSGGHVLPATVFFEHLKKDFEVSITSDRRGAEFLDREKYDIKIINTPRLSKNLFLLLFQIFIIIYLTFKSFFFLKSKKINILISTGGYMSLPLCIASKILNIKIFLFEPNMVLGRTNKLFLRFCEKIFCYSNKIKNFPNKLKKKILIIQTLLRKEFYSIKPSKDFNDIINLLIIGGSQGAELFDTAINDSIIKISKKYKLKIFQQTSYKNYKNLKNFYLKNNIENELFDFNENISEFMSRSNICVTRSGASTLAELTFLNVPYIAIPLPSAKDNHQYENASFYEDKGCNWVLNQSELNEDSLTNKLISIIENKDEYIDKKNNMKNFSYQNTWNNVNQKIITIINEN